VSTRVRDFFSCINNNSNNNNNQSLMYATGVFRGSVLYERSSGEQRSEETAHHGNHGHFPLSRYTDT